MAAASRVKTAAEGATNAMRAWVHPGPVGTTFDALAKTTVEIPQPADHEIRVKIAAATTNPVDIKRCYFPGPAYPSVFGVDGAGVVDAVGTAVTAFKPGDRVHFFNNLYRDFGSFADYSLIDAAAAVRVPEGMSFADAAVSPCAAWTAYEALYDRLRIEPGKTIYIAAGAGGVGSYAIQMAGGITKCKVITSASGANVERLRAEGNCALVVNYREQNVKDEVMKFTEGKGVDYVFEMLGEDETKESIQMLKFGGAIVHIAGAIPQLPDGGNFLKAISTHHVLIPGNLAFPDMLEKFTRYGAEVAKLITEGKVKSDISKVVGFDDVPAALSEQAGGRVRGKILISYSNPPEAVKDPKYSP